MDIQEYLAYRIGVWEKIQTETAAIIAGELLAVRHRMGYKPYRIKYPTNTRKKLKKN